MLPLQVGGFSTNVGFLQRLATHPAFIAADLDTGFIPKHLEALTVPDQPHADSLALAALAFHHFGIQQQVSKQVVSRQAVHVLSDGDDQTHLVLCMLVHC